jgi:arginase family enzyme
LSLHQDRNWPRAGDWLARSRPGGLTVIGAPVCKGSITPGHCDQAPAAIRAALMCFSTYDIDSETDIRDVAVRDLGDLPVSGDVARGDVRASQRCDRERDAAGSDSGR